MPRYAYKKFDPRGKRDNKDAENNYILIHYVQKYYRRTLVN